MSIPPTTPADVTALAHPWVDAALYAAAGAYLLAWLGGLRWSRAARLVLGIGVLLHLAGTISRGWLIGYLPLTNKFESFSAAALCVAAVAWVTWSRHRLADLVVLTVALVALGTAFRFPMQLNYPPPLMRTIWYPLHVPLSFVAYAVWTAGAAAAVAWWVDRGPEWLLRVDRLALQGFALWSLSMVAGGLWGVVAWGAYFLWDPKVVWSVILWFHYATFVHLRMTPSLATRPWVRPALALVGFVWVFVAYVGTSFFFGASSHAF